MKESGAQRVLPKKWPRARGLSQAGAFVRDCLLLLGGGFALAGAEWNGQALPFAACLVGALPMGFRPCAAAAGAVLGYALRGGGLGMAEFIALTVLLLAALAVFHGTVLSRKRWFMPLLAAGVYAALGSVSLLGGGEKTLLTWLVQTALAGGGCAIFRVALCGGRIGGLCLIGAVFSGLSGLLGAVDLGLLGAVALCAATGELLPAVILGAVMELFGGEMYAAALLLPAAFCALSRRREPAVSALAFLLLPNLALLLCGAFSTGSGLAVSAGALLGSLARRSGLLRGHMSADARQSAAYCMENAAEVLELLRGQLPQSQTPPSVSEAESVYDGAAERVCRCCARFHRCWEHRAGETYAALTGAARRIIERGIAEAGDFPAEFRENCCHLEGFVTALNQELEGMLFRRRYRMELQESRQILAEEFGCVAEYLRAMSTQSVPASTAGAVYAPEIGICSAGKDGGRVNGDRGACFYGVRGDYFVLLCDGMGTGPEAARLSAETVRLLERLLKSGVAPDAALRIMNGVELLRGSDRFTTVDLLHLNLHSGACALYKWGAAPSYWRDSEQVKKIGTASPPPGVGVGGDHTPERYELSLKRGEMLVLVSDGAGGTETECAVAAYNGDSARELAALLISGQPAEDDMTAVAISLHLCTS